MSHIITLYINLLNYRMKGCDFMEALTLIIILLILTVIKDLIKYIKK